MGLINKHIIYTLGINVSTLTESLNGNKNSLQLIMEEQMLYESFMDSIKTYAKEKWNKTITTIKDWKDTAAAVYQMIASGKIEELIGPVFRYGIKIPVKTLQALLDKTGLSELYKKYVLPIINKLPQLKGWKGFIVTLSIGSIIKYITTKLSHLSSDGLKKWILAYFSDNAIENIISKLTNFSTFISWLQPIIKGTEIIFDILKQSLDKIKSGEEIGKMLQPKTNENLNFNKNKMENKILKNIIKEEIKNILLENEPTLKGAVNLKPLISQLPGVDINDFMMAFNNIKANRALNLNHTKAMAAAMVGLIKSNDDQLLNKIMAQLKILGSK
jgi:hypothetical protein